MEEASQEKSDRNVTNETIEEIKDNIKPEIAKTDSVETDETATEHAEEITEELNSENEQGSECSDHGDNSEGESDDASVVLEREEGDGQESAPNRKVDDDEDKRNPQYIPKRGTFYEHDDRTAVDEEGEEGEKEPERSDKDAKKKVWQEKEGNKWSHDRFNDQEQAPKSRSELVAIYGYDIRNEEGPPRARRRRRYGRGPNKYTRNWEDEEAYSKPTNVSAKPPPRKPRRGGGDEEFPPLVEDNSSTQDNSSKSPEPEIKQESEIKDSAPVKHETGGGDASPDKENENGAPVNRNGHTAGKPQRGGRNGPRRDEQHMQRVPQDVRGVTKTRGFFKNGVRNSDPTRARNQRNQQKHDDDHADYIMSQNFTNRAHNGQHPHPQGVQKLEKEMANMSMQHQEFSSRGGKFSGGNTRQTSVPPRLQGEQRGSKRYSSLRQRSLPETATNPQFAQHPQFYQGGEFPPEYAGQATTAAPNNAPGLLPHPPATSASVPLNGAPHVLQASFAPQGYPQHPPPPPTFLPPVQAPVPPPYLPQQPPPPLINFAPQPQAYPQPTYTNFQHQQFPPVNPPPQPAELYQPQGGITYYSTQSQQVMPRVPQKRVKSAIPIVPPPEHKEPRGRGRLNQGDDSPVGSAPEGSPDLPHDTSAAAPLVVQQ